MVRRKVRKEIGMLSSGSRNLAGVAFGVTVTACGASYDFGETGETWTISSPVIMPDQPIPAEYTCEGRAFPVPAATPEFNWSEGPKGTESYAIVVKHLDISDELVPADDDYITGFMWAIWDIPADVHHLPANLSPAQFPPEIPGAQQWQSFNQFGWFAPCPNFDPEKPTVESRYGISLYALKTPKVDLPDLPEGVSNYVMPLALHLDVTAVGMVQLNATSSATSTAGPVPPDTLVFPVRQ